MDTRRFFFKQLLGLPLIGRAVESVINDPAPIPEPEVAAPITSEDWTQGYPVTPPRKPRPILSEYGIMLRRNGKEQFLIPDSFEVVAPQLEPAEWSTFAELIKPPPALYITAHGWTLRKHFDESFLNMETHYDFEMTTGNVGDRCYMGRCIVDSIKITGEALEDEIEIGLTSVGAYTVGVVA